MGGSGMEESTIYTVTANCQDCYRCVRACPVKAIRVSGGQAAIEDTLCVKCGTCVRECPQHAKMIRSHLDEVRKLIKSGQKVAASVAPSFAAVFSGSLAGRLPSALRLLGFHHISETAEGAKYITGKSLIPEQQGSVCTACPVVVNYVETYKPEMLELMIPVVSPMVAHGRQLKARYPGCAVVFIGPCAAKKQEARRSENQDAIDAVLTFSELLDWFGAEDIRLENCPESGFESFAPIGRSRLFPLQGGMLKTGGINSDGTDPDVIHISGAGDVIRFFNGGETCWQYQYVEPLFCKGGCINGPALPSEKNLFERRANVIDYAAVASGEGQDSLEIPYETAFNDFSSNAVTDVQVTETQLNKILERTGKTDPAFQLNCGACGYESCIDNAAAVFRGMAEAEMCIPYMRRQAQQRSDRIIETTPSGIVVLDNDLCIVKMNPAFHKMFNCSNSIVGRHISYLIRDEGFEQLFAGHSDEYQAIRTKYGIRYHEILYALRDEQQYVGIYTDISKVRYDENQLDIVKEQTVKHAREFLDHQVRFAQELAHYLGQSTAKSEEIVRRLISLYEEENKGEGP